LSGRKRNGKKRRLGKKQGNLLQDKARGEAKTAEADVPAIRFNVEYEKLRGDEACLRGRGRCVEHFAALA
jgi:hypothetical protein